MSEFTAGDPRRVSVAPLAPESEAVPAARMLSVLTDAFARKANIRQDADPAVWPWATGVVAAGPEGQMVRECQPDY